MKGTRVPKFPCNVELAKNEIQSILSYNHIQNILNGFDFRALLLTIYVVWMWLDLYLLAYKLLKASTTKI